MVLTFTDIFDIFFANVDTDGEPSDLILLVGEEKKWLRLIERLYSLPGTKEWGNGAEKGGEGKSCQHYLEVGEGWYAGKELAFQDPGNAAWLLSQNHITDNLRQKPITNLVTNKAQFI